MKATSKKRMAVIITTVLALSLFLSSISFADNAFKNLKAWFGDIKIFSNNQQVQMDVKPFIVDGITYVPIRALSNILNKNVGWDGANLRVDITDKPEQSTANIAYLSQQIMEKQLRINELESKVAQLELELGYTNKSTRYSLYDLEKFLNNEYGSFEKIKFDVDLYGNKDDIRVEIYVDLDDYYSKWNALTNSKIEKYIKNIVDDILSDYKNADITGFIEDSSKDKKLVNFNLNTKGKLVVNIKSSRNTYDLDDLEDYLNRYCDEYKDVYFEITLSGNDENIRVYVTANYDDLDYLGASNIKNYLKGLYNEIINEFKNADVYGYIEDDYLKYYFEFDSRGNISLSRY